MHPSAPRFWHTYKFDHGGLVGTGPFTPTPPPPPPSRNLVRKCLTMGAKGALRKICLI